jgi:hypothetical protein
MSRITLFNSPLRLFLADRFLLNVSLLMKKPALLLACVTWLAWPSHAALAAEAYVVPRTEWGHPDIQGVWNFSSDVPMERPEQFGSRQFLTSEELAATRARPLRIGRSDSVRRTTSGIEAFYNDTIWMENVRKEGDIRTSHIIFPLNGQIPPRVTGVEHLPGGSGRIDGQRPVRFSVGGIGRDGPEDRGLSERCLVGFNAGPQLMPSVYNNNVQIVQNRDYVVIMTEMIHDARIVKLVNGALSAPWLDRRLKLWSGDSRGYWDGDTLVVVTASFNGLTQSFEGYGKSGSKILTERFTRLGPTAIDYEFTIEDPATFTDKLTAVVPVTRVDAQLYEYACHEGNYGMANMLRAARRREAEQVSDRVADIFRR